MNFLDVITQISGLSSDSRAVQSGYLFAAFPEGASYIDQAISKGAKFILAPKGVVRKHANVIYLESSNPRQDFARLAAAYYGLQPKMLAAITGTNGKTSTASFVRQLWQFLGRRSASIGTLGVVTQGYEKKGQLTTPGTIELHEDLASLAKLGVTHVALEASSHGLDQYRLDGVKVKIAAFTNFSHEHLDYHETLEAYFKAKTRLFSDLLDDEGVAVLNRDRNEYLALSQICDRRHIKILSYGRHMEADLCLIRQDLMPEGQKLEIRIGDKTYKSDVPIFGAFQAENLLCAMGILMASGFKPDEIIAVLPKLEGVRGRMELAGHHPTGAAIYVDYAHKPEALETVLASLRPHASKGRLGVVFGCGGDRDQAKRPVMGEIASRLADFVIVTDDNPRTENPAFIRQVILDKAPHAQEIPDRRQAIAHGIHHLQRGDVLLIAGKGHELGQIVGAEILPFDDVQVAHEILEEMR